jgi:hypothetical protein
LSAGVSLAVGHGGWVLEATNSQTNVLGEEAGTSAEAVYWNTSLRGCVTKNEQQWTTSVLQPESPKSLGPVGRLSSCQERTKRKEGGQARLPYQYPSWFDCLALSC